MTTINDLSITWTGWGAIAQIALYLILVGTAIYSVIAHQRLTKKVSHFKERALTAEEVNKGLGNELRIWKPTAMRQQAELKSQQNAYESRIESLREGLKQATDANRNKALRLATGSPDVVETAKKYHRFLQGKA